MVRYSLFCKCGDSCWGSIRVEGYDGLVKSWLDVHTSPECSPCDKSTCQKIRRAQAKKEGE